MLFQVTEVSLGPLIKHIDPQQMQIQIICNKIIDWKTRTRFKSQKYVTEVLHEIYIYKKPSMVPQSDKTSLDKTIQYYRLSCQYLFFLFFGSETISHGVYIVLVCLEFSFQDLEGLLEFAAFSFSFYLLLLITTQGTYS